MIDQKRIKKYDVSDAYSSIRQLPHQIEQVMSEIKNVTFPQSYYEADCIAISGMGGSIYSYYIILTLFAHSLKKPLVAVNDYHIPSFLTPKTLFLGSSYSGSTEETIATTEKAIKNKYQVTAVTMGGVLGDVMRKNHVPYYQFDPRFNPCGQPRVGIGYMIFGTVLILEKLGYLSCDHKELKSAIKALKNQDHAIQQKAEDLKNALKDTMIILVASEHLSGVVHAGRNQINETAKVLAEYHIIPELNHHLMEGLTYPKDEKLIFIFYNSQFYYERNKKRFEVTKKVLTEQKIPFLDVSFEAENKLEEFLLYLQFGSYLSFFLGIEYGVDPSKIPWVDYFKKEMQK